MADTQLGCASGGKVQSTAEVSCVGAAQEEIRDRSLKSSGMKA